MYSQITIRLTNYSYFIFNNLCKDDHPTNLWNGIWWNVISFYKTKGNLKLICKIFVKQFKVFSITFVREQLKKIGHNIEVSFIIPK